MRPWQIAHTSCCSDNWRGAWWCGLREGDMEIKRAVVMETSVSWKWLGLEFSLFLHQREKWCFPAFCTWRTSSGLCAHISSFNSFSFLYPSGSILFPPGNRGLEGQYSHALFVPALRQRPSKEDARGECGASQGRATKSVGLWQCCQLVGTETAW